MSHVTRAANRYSWFERDVLFVMLVFYLYSSTSAEFRLCILFYFYPFRPYARSPVECVEEKPDLFVSYCLTPPFNSGSVSWGTKAG